MNPDVKLKYLWFGSKDLQLASVKVSLSNWDYYEYPERDNGENQYEHFRSLEFKPDS